MTIDELDKHCLALFGKPSSGYGVTPKLAFLCKCSEAAVRKWKSGRKDGEGKFTRDPGVPSTAAELIRVKVLAKELSER